MRTRGVAFAARTPWRVALTLISGLLVAPPAHAQTVQSNPDDLADRARIRFGPFYFQPWIALTNAGYDANVFNDYQDPKEDFTFTLTPGLDGGMRAGVARLNFRFVSDYVWYQTYDSEQGVDGTARAQFELRYDWLRPFVSADWTNTRSRPGYEIDARAERNTPVYEGGVDVRIASRTWIVLSYRRASTEFLPGEIYNGVPLGRALNNTAQTMTAGLRVEMTPLTMLTLLAHRQRVQFDTSTFRDNESWSFLPAVEFSPDALLSGRASVGYRSLTAATIGVPDFRGVVANVGLRYQPLPGTSIGLTGERDVAYSFEDVSPYYILTGAAASYAQRLIGSFEVAVQGRREWLGYRVIEGAGSPRQDTVTVYGVGAGYRFGDLGRLGLDVERARRRSDLSQREYRGTRVYGSFRFGF